jgi:hypothetical protein
MDDSGIPAAATVQARPVKKLRRLRFAKSISGRLCRGRCFMKYRIGPDEFIVSG